MCVCACVCICGQDVLCDNVDKMGERLIEEGGFVHPERCKHRRRQGDCNGIIRRIVHLPFEWYTHE